VRQRQKAAAAPANGKPHANGSKALVAALNGAAKAPPAGIPLRNGDATNGSPLLAPPRPQPSQQAQPRPQPQAPKIAETGPQPSLAPLSPNPLIGSPPPAFARPAQQDRPPNEQRPNIVSPLAEALVRASATPPPQAPMPPPGAPSVIPASLRSDTPTGVPPTAPPPLPANGANNGANGASGFPSQPGTQPDFSTLPPSIAASLARLAGTPLPTGRTSGGPAQGGSDEPKKVSNAGSGGA